MKKLLGLFARFRSMKSANLILNWVIVTYCLLILFLSVKSFKGAASLNKSHVAGFRSDYLLHVLMFVPWMVLARWRWKGINRKNIFWLALGGGIIYAGLSEAVQIFVPDRNFNMMDLAANSVGIILGALISGWGRRTKAVTR